MTPIPMLARPLLDPPDPKDRMLPVNRSSNEDAAVWLCAGSLSLKWHINPGRPGEPERLPWKRRDQKGTP